MLDVDGANRTEVSMRLEIYPETIRDGSATASCNIGCLAAGGGLEEHDEALSVYLGCFLLLELQ